MGDTENTASASREIIGDFLRQVGIEKQTIDKPDADGVIEQLVRKKLQLTDLSSDQYDKHLKTGLAIATTAYAHTPIDVQVHIATFTLLAEALDDFDLPASAITQFMPRFVTAQPQLSLALEAFANNLLHMSDFYPPHAADGIVTSALYFVNSNQLGHELRNSPVRRGAEEFAIYCRNQNGAPQAYGFFIWDKLNFPDVATYIQAFPDTMVFVNHVNDILSFYKEELEGDLHNVVHSRAVGSGKDVHSVLREMVREVSESVTRCRMLLEGKERQAFEAFMSGYITFHYLAPRYRLHEIAGI